MEKQVRKTLPPEAYRELKPGEKYIPYVPPEVKLEEVTTRSVSWGLFMTLLFTFAAAYLGLKVGTVFEAAIPIAILAVGIGTWYSRKNTILENVIIQSIGAASGAIVAGGIFTLPALFILDLPINFLMMFFSTFLGGCLGIFFLVPLRRFFCLEQHGKLPFPEATATTEILVAGETGGKQAKVLLISMLIGGIYDFLAIGVKLWNELLTFKWFDFTQKLAEKTKIVLKIDALAAFLGLGYIIGLRYNAVIVAGSLLSHFAFIPIIWFIGQHLSQPLYPGSVPIIQMNEVEIFRTYVQKIGIGAIAMAGFLGIVKSLPIMIKSFSIGFKEIFKKTKGNFSERVRTDIDLRMSTIIIGTFLTAIAIFIYFLIISNAKFALLGVIICFLLSFLFTTVAAYAIAIVGTNPVSGMTLITLIISSVILIGAGLSGEKGMAVALLIGAVVCTALSLSGSFITDLKIGYWLGATPRNQERFKFSGVLIAAIIVGLAIFLLDQAFSFKSEILPAPQANLMAAIIKSLMSKEPITWILFGIGALIALIIEMSVVPTLAFALGMYLPLELTTPLLIGGFLSYLVKKSAKEEDIAQRRKQRGTLIASGFIAGGALMGIIYAGLKVAKIDRFISVGVPIIQKAGKWIEGAPASWYLQYGEILSLIAFIFLCYYLYFGSKKAI